MSKKVQNRDYDSLNHTSRSADKPIKLLEVTQDNLNSVLLELKKDKTLLKLNFKNIVNFMFKTCLDNAQFLSKLKILQEVDNNNIHDNNTVVDSIFWIITKVLGYNLESGLEKVVVLVSGEIYPFSRRLSLWYFENKQLEDEEVEFYLEEIERIIFKTANVNFITEEFDEEECEEECVDGDSSSISVDYNLYGDTDMNQDTGMNKDKGMIKSSRNQDSINEDTNILTTLTELTDSEEIDRLDKALGLVFKPKVGLSVADKKRIAKCLDVIESILENNSIEKTIHFKRLLGLVDIDDVLFKKVFRVLKLLTKKYSGDHLEDLYALYAKALYKYRNISRTIDTMQEYFKGLFKWTDVLKASLSNESLDLNIVDRSKVSKEEFYSFCFEGQVHLWKIQKLLLYFTRKEENVKILKAFIDLINKIEFSDERLSMIESINNRMKALGG